MSSFLSCPRRYASAWLLLACLLFTGCTDNGGTKGEGASVEGETADPDLDRVCADSCETLGHECGDVCGIRCGACDSDQACVAGRCVCVPSCEASACGGDDGCGGTCPCASDQSCSTCGLVLTKVAHAYDHGVVRAVSLAVNAGDLGKTSARMAELRIASDTPMVLARVSASELLGAAKKRLHRFTRTNLPFERLEDGSFRILVLSGEDHLPLGKGRWLKLDFEQTAEPIAGPVTFRLVRRVQTLAPADADLALQATSYDAPLTISAVR